MSNAILSRRGLLIMAVAVRLNASDSDFWKKKPPSDWTPEEIERLLRASPWAKEITPMYTSLPQPIDRRPWGETPPTGRGQLPPRKTSVKAPYRATIRWESAEPVRSAQKIALPAAFTGYHAIGIFFAGDAARDFGSKPIENLKESAALLSTRAVDAQIVQVHPEIKDGFLVGFPKNSSTGVKRLEFSACIGLLALKTTFDARDMLYHGQLAL